MTAALFRWTRIGAMLPLALLLGRVALAQDAQPDDQDDPPDRVARLSYLQGDVSLLSAQTGDAERAELNRPLTSGDEIDVGERARAELQVDVASLHIGERSSVSLEALDDQTLSLRLIDGEMVVRVRELREGDRVEIETANARISLMEPGEYRLEAQSSGETTIVGVRAGGTEIVSGEQAFTLHAGQEGRYSGTSELDEDVRSLSSRDSLEAWAAQREERSDEDSPSTRYVSRDVIGYEDLDEYGNWESDSMYGPVWYPRRIAYGWSPYRFGQWSYISPWGWTWIDQAPWGFAPFHYGRWAYLRSRWCWVPGPRHVRPVYAPALVGWVPRGGGYAWVPLGPREVYVPRHHASDRYLRRVNVSNTNIVNVNNVTNVYRNRTAPGRYMNERLANNVTAIPRETFTASRPPVRAIGRPAPGGRPTALRPTYQTPTLRQSPEHNPRRDSRDTPVVDRTREVPRETPSSGRALPGDVAVRGRDVPVRELERPQDTRGTREVRDLPSGSIPRGNVPQGNLPQGKAPQGSIPRYIPPPVREVPRAVSPPSSRTQAPVRSPAQVQQVPREVRSPGANRPEPRSVAPPPPPPPRSQPAPQSAPQSDNRRPNLAERRGRR